MSGPKNWIFLRGLGRESRHWDDMPELFKKVTGAKEVRFLDLPGTGKEFKKSSPDSIEGFINSLNDSLGSVEGKWGIVGVSFGGMIGLSWCAQKPDLFSHLVLVNSSASDLSWPWERMKPQGLAQLLKAGTTKDLKRREEILLKILTQNHKNISAKANRWAAYAKECPLPIKSFVNQLRAAAQFKLPRSISQNLLILNSKGDNLVDPRCSEKLAQFYNVPLISHDWGGHDLSVDDPQWIVTEISKFLRGASKSSP